MSVCVRHVPVLMQIAGRHKRRPLCKKKFTIEKYKNLKRFMLFLIVEYFYILITRIYGVVMSMCLVKCYTD